MGSCGVSNLVIEGGFPTPNINKIPLSMAIFYDDALREFSYMEYSETGREEINIESGNHTFGYLTLCFRRCLKKSLKLKGWTILWSMR